MSKPLTSHHISWTEPKKDINAFTSLPPVLLKAKTSVNQQEKKFSLLKTLSSIASPRQTTQPTISQGEMIRQQFYQLLKEPISEQHQRHFRKHFGGDISTKTFNVEEFSRLFQVKSILSRRILIAFHLQIAYENNSISGEDVIRIAHLLWISSMSIKAFILFKFFDTNDDEKITTNEIRTFYEHYLSEFKFFPNREKIHEVVEIFLQGFFPSNQSDNEQQQNELNFDEFYEILQQNSSVFKSLYLISIPDQDKDDEEKQSFFQRSWMYIKNNTNRIVFLILYILIQIGLITYVAIYRSIIVESPSGWQITARIGGMLVNFNFALAITLMLKQTMTFIRRLRYLRFLIPVDDHIDAHRYVGGVLFVSAVVHSLGHAIHFATHTEEHSWAASMFTTAAEIGWVKYSATITGDILFVFLVIMVICSLQCIRQRSGCFQLFRYTHYLFWFIFILLILHAENFWKWSIGPMSLLVVEKIYLFKRHLPKYGRTRLISIRIEDENVISLIIERPVNFHFHIGEYINICLPNIVRNEWHPFTICSSPEREDILRLSIMKKKNWTKKIYEHFSTHSRDLTQVSTDSNSREIHFTSQDKDAIVCIEGPFSTCTSYIFDCEHVVLIGAGIGITPYISALESLVHQLKAQSCICFRCGAKNYNEHMLTKKKLKKIDFIWVNREMGNFSWFLNILNEFENEQEDYLNAQTPSMNHQQETRSRYLDIHLYCTSIRSNDQAMLANLPYDLVANMYEVMKHQDMHTQLKTPTHVGRPPWKLLFAKFKAEHRSTNVFFTGNKIMAEEIKDLCDEYRFQFQNEPYF